MNYNNLQSEPIKKLDKKNVFAFMVSNDVFVTLSSNGTITMSIPKAKSRQILVLHIPNKQDFYYYLATHRDFEHLINETVRQNSHIGIAHDKQLKVRIGTILASLQAYFFDKHFKGKAIKHKPKPKQSGGLKSAITKTLF